MYLKERYQLILTLIVNLIPLYGIFTQNWNYKEIILCYWLESIIILIFTVLTWVISVYNIKKEFSKNPDSIYSKTRIALNSVLIFITLFFAYFIGFIFTLALISKLILIGEGFIDLPLILSNLKSIYPFAISLFISNAYLFFSFIKKYETGQEYHKFIFNIVIMRAMVLFLAIFVGGILLSKFLIGIVVAVSIIIFKTFLELAILDYTLNKKENKGLYTRLKIK
jgi:hypothetical protein